MTAFSIIQKKQRGQANSAEEIRFMVQGALAERVEPAQLSAWFMAIYFQGMNPEETWTLTREMLESGRVLQRGELSGLRVDKHSTGGVGDKVTFVLAPVWAACGLQVPTITGRGLGLTGGTVDKLECLPGIELGLEQEAMQKVLAETGLCILRQTQDLVPADRIFYALRDVTATVESVPLICASILSKKLAEDLDQLVLDVKCGSGAIFATEEQAAELAEALVAITAAGGRKACALLSDMDTPLGRQVGNWNELVESAECLQGHGPADLMEVVYALGAAGLLAAGRCASLEEAIRLQQEVIHSGKAFEALLKALELQGGNTERLRFPHRAPRPTRGLTVTHAQGGTVLAVDARAIGQAALLLGAGRQRREDAIDALAGLSLHRKPGESLRPGEALADVYCSTPEGRLEEAAALVREAYTLGAEEDFRPRPMLLRAIGAPFDPDEWRRVYRNVGDGLKPHPLWRP